MCQIVMRPKPENCISTNKLILTLTLMQSFWENLTLIFKRKSSFLKVGVKDFIRMKLFISHKVFSRKFPSRDSNWTKILAFSSIESFSKSLGRAVQL